MPWYMDMDAAVVEGIFTLKEHHRAALKTFLSGIDILTLHPPDFGAVLCVQLEEARCCSQLAQ